MAMQYKIHPAIGIARLGDSPASFYIAPEGEGDLPIECDPSGHTTLDPKTGREQRIATFRDPEGRIKRQAARFRVYGYDDSGAGRELKIGDELQMVAQKSGQLLTGTLVDIQWTVYLANKKASWYQFQQTDGEYGYSAGHPLRNPDITDPVLRQSLIIDPGPQTVSQASNTASFAQTGDPPIPQSFPPPLSPNSITTLGDLLVSQQDQKNRLLVLGGHGNSGSMKSGFGEPHITSYANNDGWFDDISDGPVSARLQIKVTKVDGRVPTEDDGTRTIPVDDASWVIVGYPRYAPQITDIVTLDDTLYDLAVRQFAYDTTLYGLSPYDGTHKAPVTPDELTLWRQQARFNRDYYPQFWRDIWPILSRPNKYQFVMDFDPFTGGDPHNDTPGGGGNLDPKVLSVPPRHDQDPTERESFKRRRQFLYAILRKPGQENLYTRALDPNRPDTLLPGMPLLCGDNPISNTAASKFLRLSETMLFLLRQWAEGKFVNERDEHFTAASPTANNPDSPTGAQLDRGVLTNLLGGSFCPGAEACWIVRNPAIYRSAYRIHARRDRDLTPGALRLNQMPGVDDPYDISKGLEPGDISKYDAVPWQSDFNECSTQNIDITYEDWNQTEPASVGDPRQTVLQTIYWWPSHRPMEVMTKAGAQIPWSGKIPQSPAGDLMMVSDWKEFGFVKKNDTGDPTLPDYFLVEGKGAGQ